MSAKDRLRNSGLFWERCRQTNPSYRGTVGFTLLGYKKGPTIYATDLGWFGIRIQAFDNKWFSNSLYEFVRVNHFDISTNDQTAYMIDDSHIGEVIDIIRGRSEN